MSDLVLLGIVIGAYGIRGQVRLRSFASSPCDIGGYGSLQDSSGREYAISSLRLAKGDIVICNLSGVDSRNAVEALLGTELFVDRSLLKNDDADSYYHIDLIGLGVVDEAGEKVGEVVNVCNYGGGDLLEIRISSGAEILLIFNRDNVLAVAENVVLSSIGVEALNHVEG